MKAARVIAALGLPPATRVEQRIPKKLLQEQGAPTAADKRAIQEGIEELRWVAALKPDNIGVPAWKDAERDYLEVHVLTAVLRPGAKAARLVELIHRAIPYPLLLVTEPGPQLSLAHKRRSQAVKVATVLDGTPHLVDLAAAGPLRRALLGTLPLAAQPRGNLHALYQGWLDCLAAPEEHARLQLERLRLRNEATRESQLNRRAELNLQVRELDRRIANLTNKS